MKVLMCMAMIALTACVPEKYRRFAEPSPEADAQFQRLPLEEQLDVYLYLTTKSHPPKLDYADLIATRGKEAVAPIMHAVTTSDSDLEKQRLLYILGSMATNGHYDFRDAPSVLQQTERVIDAMSDEHHAKLSRYSLAAMRRAATGGAR